MKDIHRLTNSVDPIHLIFSLEHCNAVQTRAMAKESNEPSVNKTATQTLPTKTNTTCLPHSPLDSSNTNNDVFVFKFSDRHFTKNQFIDKQIADPFIAQIIRNLNCACKANN